MSHEFEVISIYNTPHLVLGAHVLSSSNHPLLLKPHMNAIRIVQLDPRQLVFKKYFRVLGLRGGPHPGVPARFRCANRSSALDGARTQWGHAGEDIGVSEAVAGMFPPGNGDDPKDAHVFKRCSQATFGAASDEKPRLWMESVSKFSRERDGSLLREGSGVAVVAGGRLSAGSRSDSVQHTVSALWGWLPSQTIRLPICSGTWSCRFPVVSMS